jgi:hypothetical protein
VLPKFRSGGRPNHLTGTFSPPMISVSYKEQISPTWKSMHQMAKRFKLPSVYSHSGNVSSGASRIGSLFLTPGTQRLISVRYPATGVNKAPVQHCAQAVGSAGLMVAVCILNVAIAGLSCSGHVLPKYGADMSSGRVSHGSERILITELHFIWMASVTLPGTFSGRYSV